MIENGVSALRSRPEIARSQPVRRSFITSPVPTVSATRPGWSRASVARSNATSTGWRRSPIGEIHLATDGDALRRIEVSGQFDDDAAVVPVAVLERQGVIDQQEDIEASFLEPRCPRNGGPEVFRSDYQCRSQKRGS